MKVDIRGRVNNISLPASKPLLPLFEAVINAIHAVEDSGRKDGLIRIEVQRSQAQERLNLGDRKSNRPISGFVITDNGVGFTDQHFESFETSDSRFKLSRGAKGIGRFLWLKAFEKVHVVSSYRNNGNVLSRMFRFSIPDQGVVPEPPPPADLTTGTGSRVELIGYTPQYEKFCPKRAATIAERVVEHCLVYFLSPGCPKIQLLDQDESETLDLNSMFKDKVLPHARSEDFKVGDSKFSVVHIKLYAGETEHHAIHFCAHNRSVTTEPLQSRVPHLRNKIKDSNGDFFTYVAYVSGGYLDQHVNSERTGFNLPVDGELAIDGKLTKEALLDATVQRTKKDLEAYLDAILDEAKARVAGIVENNYPEFRPLLDRIVSYIDEIPQTADVKTVALKLSEIQFREEMKVREQAKKLAAVETTSLDEEEFDKQMQEQLEQISESGMSRLAQYVIQRKLVLDLLKKRLEMGASGKYSKEEDVHRIVFPTKKTSNEVAWGRQNLWIIDERLVYHTFLASDKPLQDLKVIGSQTPDRPDLIVFNRPGAFTDSDELPFQSVVIIEFKRPERTSYDQSPIDQVLGYVREIRSASVKAANGRTVKVGSSTPFYCYIICDLTEQVHDFAKIANLTITPDQLGYFGYNTNFNAYLEILSFDKLVQDSVKRNHVLFERLQLK